MPTKRMRRASIRPNADRDGVPCRDRDLRFASGDERSCGKRCDRPSVDATDQ
jgi:hypothetical protein